MTKMDSCGEEEVEDLVVVAEAEEVAAEEDLADAAISRTIKAADPHRSSNSKAEVPILTEQQKPRLRAPSLNLLILATQHRVEKLYLDRRHGC